MLVAHLLVAGPVEAVVTGGVVVYLQRTHSSLIKADAPKKKEGKLWLLWGALGLVALATPIGLLASGTAWGEWGIDELKTMGLGFIPQGLQKLAGWWPAPMPDYGLPRMAAVIGYILSAFVGIILIAALFWLLGRWLSRKNKEKSDVSSEGGTPGKLKGDDFLTKSISGFSRVLESVVTTEDISRAPGLLQSLDPRVKLVSFLLFIVGVSLVHSLPVFGGIFVLIFLMSLASKVSPGFFLKRVLIFVPIFTLVIAIPALFLTAGQPLVHIRR